ncbi:MAG: efflux transporter outer membrane subunit [Rhizobiaceae bacterium]
MVALSNIQILLRRIASCLALLLLTACMVGPDFERPDAPILDSWSKGANLEIDSRTGFTTRSATSVPWWTLFNDPVLNELIAEAYEQNLGLDIAGARVAQARAQLGIATGELFPQKQQLAGQIKKESFSENNPIWRPIREVIPFDNHITRKQIGFDAAWEIDLWGKIRRNIQSADANLFANIASYDDALVTVTGDVAATYVVIRQLQQLIAITRQNAALQKQSLDIAKLRQSDGVATELDVDEAEILYNDTLAKIPAYEADLSQAKNALSLLLSEPPGQLEGRLGGSKALPRAPAEVAIGIPADLIRRRPDIRKAEYLAAAQSAQIGVATADFYPAISITGTIGFEASDFGDLFSPSSLVKVIAPGFTWEILNYGRILNNVRVQDAKFEQLMLNYKNTVLNAYAETENALVAFLKSKQSALYLSRSVRSAKRAVKIVLDQYKDGTADYNRVVDIQRNLLLAQEQLLVVQAEVLTNLIAIYKSLGGGWIPDNVEGYISADVTDIMSDRTNWGDLL